jgi:hypothetical protein
MGRTRPPLRARSEPIVFLFGACGRKLFARKAIKKRAAKPERTFLGKKVHAFRGDSAQGNDDAKPEEQRAMFVSGFRATKGKNFARFIIASL